MSDAEAIIPASHTYDESKNVAVDGGKATVKSCSVCKLTTVVAGSGEGTPAYTVTLGGEHLTFTAEGDPEGISNDNSAGNLEDNPQ